MLKQLSPIVLTAGLLLGGCAADDSKGPGNNNNDNIVGSSLTIENDSDYAFFEINLSPTDFVSWGPDVLGGDILFPGEAVEIGDIDCDLYDIRIVDEDGDECIIDEIDLCFNDETWVIDNLMLAVCSSF